MANKNSWRLDRNVLPSQYFVSLSPNFDDFTFRGLVSIKIKIKEPTSVITLHTADIDITKANASSGNTAKNITYNKKHQTVSLEFTDQLRSGTRWLTLEFNGKLNDKMNGFYRTSYIVDGKKRWGAATQFEATDARRAFPCFDEPDMKARFTIQLVVPSHMTALSNMPAYPHPVSPDRKYKTVTFEETLTMSTYLVAFVVAELERVEGFTKDLKPVRIWATPSKKEMCRFALSVALDAIEYFEKWYGIPYAFPKLDMVALPDFASGAMENWGLITYRETALLIDEKNSSAAARQRVAEVETHELAHQWFGNLVTMLWWSHLWLNEGFAVYAETKAIADLFPDWDIWTQYTETYLAALRDDALNNTHPIEVPVKNPEEIREIFDSITYSKGSVVNRMLEHYLGEENFTKGLRLYFERFAFGNAATDDLWQALEDASGKPVSELMARYTRQKGFPVVIASLEEDNILSLKQKRFIFDGSTDPSNPLWHIPVSVQISGKKKPVSYYMRSRRGSINLETSRYSWLKLNPGQSGYYRVAYSPELLGLLGTAVAVGDMSVIDRIGLLNDTFALARAGLINTKDALMLLENYTGEDNYNVWIEISADLKQAGKLISDDTFSFIQFKSFARDFFRPIAEAKGWDKIPGESHTDIFLRSLAIANMSYWEDQNTIHEAMQRFNSFVDGGTLDPDIRNAVFLAIARHGGNEEFDKLVKLYENAPSPEESVRALKALGSFKDPEIHARALEMALSDKVRSQDKLALVWNFNKKALALTWEFLKENWDTFLALYGHGGLGFMRALVGLPEGFSTREQLENVERFFATHDVPGAERAVKQCLETIRCNIAWRERSRDDVIAWLEEKFSYRT